MTNIFRFLLVYGALIPLVLFSQGKEKKKDIIFVKNFSKKEGSNVDPKFVESISQQFYLETQDKLGNKYNVNDESVMRSLNSKMEELLRKNCDADKCMEAIADNVRARYSLYGEIEDWKSQEGSYILKLTNIVRDAEGDTNLISTVIKFREFQKDYYIQELIKTIENPKYKPDESKAPKTPQLDLRMGDLSFKPIESGKLPDIQSLKLDSKTLDVKRYNEALEKGNALREAKNYQEAANQYLNLREILLEKDPESQKKLIQYTKLSETYFIYSVSEQTKSQVEQVSQRIVGKDPNIPELQTAIQELLQIKANYESYKKPEYPANTFQIELAQKIDERIESMSMVKFKKLEAKGDQLYYKQEFADAIQQYQLINSELKEFNSKNPELKKLKTELQMKAETTERNGKALVESLLSQILERIEDLYEDWKLYPKEHEGNKQEWMKQFDQAYQILTSNKKYSPFVGQSLIDRYNKRAMIIIKNPKISDRFKPNTTGGENKTNRNLASVFIPETGLTWTKCSLGQEGDYCEGIAEKMNWENAINACSKIVIDGKTFRLPSIFELKTLIDINRRPSIDFYLFPNTYSEYYWSQSSSTSLSTNAAVLNFYNADIYSYGKVNDSYVRCVSGP
jgi:hypothetical protein